MTAATLAIDLGTATGWAPRTPHGWIASDTDRTGPSARPGGVCFAQGRQHLRFDPARACGARLDVRRATSAGAPRPHGIPRAVAGVPHDGLTP